MNNRFSILILVLTFLLLNSCKTDVVPSISNEINRFPEIFPDYKGVTIPYNIAPLNFSVLEEGESYYVRISGKNGNDILIKSKNKNIKIDIKKWHELLDANKGEEISIDLYINKDGKWSHYNTINNVVANEAIDSYISYRLINSAYVLWFEMGIYQRNLTNFDESPLIESKSIGGACINCHTLSSNNPEKFMFHVRAKFPGTLIYNNDQLKKVETKTDITLASAAYGAWHPNGRHIAFSVNKINQNFHVFKDQSNEVSDKYSDLVIYDTETNQLTTSQKVKTNSRENLPEWSADGNSIYFISAEEAVTDSIRIITKYNLMQIQYDTEKNIWGEVDTIISSNETGKSITFPRCSPDGKYLTFCMTNYGYFTIHHKTSDLFLLNLNTNEFKAIDIINSKETESYHSWSTNSRWMIFSSRRIDGVHTRTFITYFDENGNFHKPFVLPQNDPEKYKKYLLNYNRPELMTGKIELTPQQIRDAVRRDAEPVLFDPSINIDAFSGASGLVN